ncbi:MAG: bifunctional 2-polyprenyl-6-hydroxyphenol methylase/3-demethylubiquinol 3-O-methyltransferase UbiG [Simkania sp.]|nr:bifunctional 2-polyprenyl-6-hydroxyphenol methylase/3-demethylubiquinol 3-O-methyltransferase UbiG [Simkania sp.]
MSTINNAFYDELGSRWGTDCDHPIALLRAENALRNPWIASLISKDSSVLDIGCGAGLLTNDLAKRHIRRVVGIDLSLGALKEAKEHDQTAQVLYKQANANALPFDNEEFDVVCAMDVLEHVEDPEMVIKEASRVLKPGGLFFFHTFNRNWLSYFTVIKGLEWFVANTPKNLHVYPLFIKPRELKAMLSTHGLQDSFWQGIRPVIRQKAWKAFFSKGRITPDFRFRFVNSLSTGYCGYAVTTPSPKGEGF